MQGFVVTEGFIPSETLNLYDYTATYASATTKINGKRILVSMICTLKTNPSVMVTVIGNAINMRIDNVTPIISAGVNSTWFSSPGQNRVKTECY